MKTAIYDILMSGRNPDEAFSDARFFALCISHRAMARKGNISMALGLEIRQLSHLFSRYFPRIEASRSTAQCTKAYLHNAAGGTFLCQCLGKENQASMRNEETGDLVKLLLDHCAGVNQSTEWVAAILAAGCLGDDHLWQDLGLTNREDLSDIIKHHFPRLYFKNAGNMKWKKFFYKQLCDQAEVRLCQAPSCNVCNDYAQCFGPEDASAWNLLAAQG
ncbi:nitrogen fixation protein NifQ [Acidithiobacillus ferriphilus]|jgi:NifQ.|uniref:nitrogen fixation protein NifQ n=1 Tax=Acidithiobacillus TaxID=119977 RepID=UPI001C078D42|nr:MULTISPECIES: nitrogen fixation protein NifQ [Acidithiobacillus]MBU2847914.1 nitrogen fixation protein NifQ [Acidithiobacillus ferriphilus]MDA8245379.1 nitrogen fixation protein NifQ [Acidithiobacillus sp.]MEB8535838.1 nitrogen fixation protein NifQ [Acidithiobacillus ferriphilus]